MKRGPMHELSIAQGIIEIVEQYVPEQRRRFIRSVTVEVGAISGVVADSLVFSFEAIVTGTLLEPARLIIKPIPVVLHCLDCEVESEQELPVYSCPECGKNSLKMISGSELQVKEVELDEHETEEPR